MTVAELLAEAARELGSRGVPGARVGRRAPAAPRARLGPGHASSPPRARRVGSEPERALPRASWPSGRGGCRSSTSPGFQAFWKHEFRVTRGRADPASRDRAAGRDGARAAARSRASRRRRRRHRQRLHRALARRRETRRRGARDRHLRASARRGARQRSAARPRRTRASSTRASCSSRCRGSRDVSTSSSAIPPTWTRASAPRSSPEVREHEPGLALFPPGDAAWIYRRLAPDGFRLAAPRRLPGGRDRADARGRGRAPLRQRGIRRRAVGRRPGRPGPAGARAQAARRSRRVG